MGKWIKYFFIIFFSYFFLQSIVSAFFSKEDTTETVVVRITSKKLENIDVGKGDSRSTRTGMFTSTYKYVYELEPLERDGWIGNIKYIYSDLELDKNKIYGLELEAIETTTNFQFWLVPTIWCDYAFHILNIYNYRPEMKGVDFQKVNPTTIFNKIKNTYNMWNRIPDQNWSDVNYSRE
jgi:hypothetical protein